MGRPPALAAFSEAAASPRWWIKGARVLRPRRATPGRIAAGECSGNRMEIYHSMTAAPQVSPAPKTTSSISSPRDTFPEETASSKAIATEAAEVLP